MDIKTGQKILKILFAAFLVSLLAGFGFAQRREPMPASELRAEISLLNLINGLELTPPQAALLLAKAQEAKRLEDRWRAESEGRRSEVDAVLAEIKAALRQKKELPEELALRFRRLDDELKSTQADVEKSRRELAGEVKASLASQQIYQLERFVPCIIPPKGELRVGQVGDSSGLARRLERLRSLPDRAYRFRREEICRGVLAGFQKRFPKTALDEEALLSDIGRVLDRCRSLCAAEFELQKNQLAEGLVSLFKPDLASGDITRKIDTFLLSEEVIPLLQERLAG